MKDNQIDLKIQGESSRFEMLKKMFIAISDSEQGKHKIENKF